MSKIAIQILLCSLFFKSIVALKIINFFVPRSTEWGQSVTLQCHYDLELDKLHRITWTKDNDRFYRFTSLSVEPELTDTKGIHVNRTVSNATHVVLDNVDADSDGVYACEVQTKGPAFKTAFSERKMSVYYLPKELLKIEGSRSNLMRDNSVDLTCIASPSFPETYLHWEINDNNASVSQVSGLEIIQQKDGLKVSKLRLQFNATKEYFKNGSIKLRCVGSITLKVDGVDRSIGDLSKSVEIKTNSRIEEKANHESVDYDAIHIEGLSSHNSDNENSGNKNNNTDKVNVHKDVVTTQSEKKDKKGKGNTGHRTMFNVHIFLAALTAFYVCNYF